MIILQSLINKLYENDNLVGFKKVICNEALEVLAAFVVLIDGELKQWLYCKNTNCLYELTGQCLSLYGHGDDIPEVVLTDTPYFIDPNKCHTNDYNIIFGELMNYDLRSPHFKLLGMVPTKRIYPILDSSVVYIYDDIETFITPSGEVHPAKMLITLRHTGQWRSNKPPKLPFGNVMIWSELDHKVYWVTQVDGLVQSIGEVTTAMDYSNLANWLSKYTINGFSVHSVTNMPYHLPKITPEEPPVDHTKDALNVLLSATPGDLDLGALMKLKSHLGLKTDSSELVETLKIAIAEYFIILDGVGSKKRQEIRNGILEHFEKLL